MKNIHGEKGDILVSKAVFMIFYTTYYVTDTIKIDAFGVGLRKKLGQYLKTKIRFVII